MKLKSIAITKADREKREEAYKEGPKTDAPEYPYETQVRFDHDTLSKIGLSKLPAVGDYMILTARVCVRSTEEREDVYTPGDHKRRSMSVQIEKMALETDGDEEDEA